MTSSRWFVLCSLATVLLGSAARASAQGASGPAWCKGATEPRSATLADALSSDPARALGGIVRMQCFPRTGSTDDTKPNRDAVEAARQQWSKRLELGDAEWVDAVSFAANPLDASALKVDDRHAWSTLDPFEQYAALRGHAVEELNYQVDALDDRLSELGKLGYLTRCMTSDLVTEWAICAADVAAFDPRKVIAELRADRKHEGWERIAGRLALDEIAKLLGKHATDVKQALGKDAAYKQLFDLAAAARTDWAHHRNAALLELVLAMDDARVTSSRKALEGCDDKTWAAWKQAVAAIPAARFSLIYKDVFTDVLDPAAATIAGEPDGFLAGLALVGCHPDKPDLLVRTVRAALEFWPGSRGPRSAAHLAMVRAGVELDDRNAKLTFPAIDRRALLGDRGGASHGGGGLAQIKAVKSKGATVELVFAGSSSKESQCVDYRAGKRLSRIESDGRLVYEGTCLKYAMVTVQHSAPDPIEAPARYAGGLKPGMAALFLETTVLIGLPKLGAAAPSMVFGVDVK